MTRQERHAILDFSLNQHEFRANLYPSLFLKQKPKQYH